ncbi:MAG: T9SS type A sorting domain-containing protein [Bacteroidetes bacterium]|nr:T9SS type A sorting domain-containing protein [Bacteroidota bacterium]
MFKTIKLILCFSAFPVIMNGAIGHTQITYSDPLRSNRAIQTEIYYPAATAGDDVPVSAGTYPVIVFGHGFVMVWSAYQNIWEALVPEGYIVAFPRTEGNINPNHAEFGADLAFLTAKLQSESATNTSSLFYGHVNSRSAIMGHSMGGGSSFLAAAGNTSITTMITLAAANTNPSSITAAAQVTVPSLVFAGEFDCVAPPVQHQVPMYDSLASACKAFVQIDGGGHCYFAESNFNCSFGEGTCTPNPTISRIQQQDATQDMAILWLAYYLKDDCQAWTRFSDSLAQSGRLTGQMSCPMPTPVITQNGNQLSSTSATTYQWYLNGQPLAGATAQNYTPTQNGQYYVQTTYGNNCPVNSNTLTWLSTALPAALNAGLVNVYPNPAAESCTIEYTGLRDEALQISLVTLTGQCVQRTQTTMVAGQLRRTVLDLHTLPAGAYLLILQTPAGDQLVSRLMHE